MRTNRKTRVSFSDNPPVLNVELPKAWTELSQEDLAAVFTLKAAFGHEPGRLSFELFRHFSGCRVRRSEGDRFKCTFVSVHADGKLRKVTVPIKPEHLAELLSCLDFVLDPGCEPVRLDFFGGAAAIDAELHGADFGTYLQLENLYQGFLQSQDPEALRALAVLLYPGISLGRFLPEPFVINVLQWMMQLKALFAQMWPNFFRPATGQETAASMLEVMNAEMRALTGGDITKEDIIMAADCWRALTELDFKAKEAEELRRKTHK